MRFIKIYDIRGGHNGIEVLLCEAHHENGFVFHTGVRADWERPRGSFSKEYCTILDLDSNREGGSWHVFHSSSSLLVRELRGQHIIRMSRLHLLMGNSIHLPGGWVIRPA